MENQNRTSNVDEKLRKLKMEGIKNVSLLSSPQAKAIDTLLYVDDSILTVKNITLRKDYSN
jgi:hypothetical protein